MAEPASAGKFFSGFLDFTQYIKTFAISLRMIIIVAIIYFTAIGGYAWYKKITAKPQKTTIGTVTGNVDASTCGTKTKIGVINI